MCSFTITNKKINLHDTNYFSQKRGPDLTEIVDVNDIQILHNLLQITGEMTSQPIIDNDLVCVMNGEIYNYKSFGDYESDVLCILPLYKEYGMDFAKRLDGEFAIVIIDFEKDELILINDTFATKPLWIQSDGNEFALGSYQSSVEICGYKSGFKMWGNYAWKFKLSTMEQISSTQLVEFDITQHKDSYDDWITAFQNSIRKRTENTKQKMFLGLSAGYDSGAITCELNKQSKKYTAYTIMSGENPEIINARHNLINDGEIIHLTKAEYKKLFDRNRDECEEFTYKDMYKDYNIKNDKASVGLAAICSRANKRKQKIYFSGQGADEIISDYGFNGNKIYDHSSFGGKFPDDLNGFFPWHSFYDGTQIQYLNKEEYVAGSFGIETRYPFLDKDLVQEFLWLSVGLKNKQYKAPLHHYLQINNFPFEAGRKTGFQANSNLR
tara:strand:+ start:651 stop:1967 length:1317 start_codon:yes stop_codon:yes gene_type:complete